MALKRSKNGKSPGPDGFSYEFYKVFFKDLSWFLLRSLNYAYEHGDLSITQKYGIITLLQKVTNQEIHERFTITPIMR